MEREYHLSLIELLELQNPNADDEDDDSGANNRSFLQFDEVPGVLPKREKKEKRNVNRHDNERINDIGEYQGHIRVYEAAYEIGEYISNVLRDNAAYSAIKDYNPTRFEKEGIGKEAAYIEQKIRKNL